ncbi:ZinT family metal-binding protein [Alteribacillus sp. HJP-4]
MVKWASVLMISTVLAACQDSETEQDAAEDGQDQTADSGGEEENSHDHEEEEHDHEHSNGNDHDAPEDIDIQGLADHYHTGDTVNLTAELNEETDNDHWHWYIRDNEDDEWETVPDQENSEFTGEASIDGQEIKAVLFGDDHEAYAQSSPAKIVIDDHGHGDDEDSQRIYDGYFEDDEVEDRELSDWEGDWQSVYPYLQDGDLDEVFKQKAQDDEDMTEEEYKEYYEEGYETETERIVIEGNTVTFFENGEESSGEYKYDGYEILTYEAGNKGVRYVFELTEDNEEMPQYIQFSDHIISPEESHHFHLYWGDDRKELLEEVTHWPTYYPSELDSEEIVNEMTAH